MRQGLLLAFLLLPHFGLWLDAFFTHKMAQEAQLQQLRDLLKGVGLPHASSEISDVSILGEVEAGRAYLAQVAATREEEGVLPSIEDLVGEVSAACRGLVSRLAGLSPSPRPPEVLPGLIEVILRAAIYRRRWGKRYKILLEQPVEFLKVAHDLRHIWTGVSGTTVAGSVPGSLPEGHRRAASGGASERPASGAPSTVRPAPIDDDGYAGDEEPGEEQDKRRQEPCD